MVVLTLSMEGQAATLLKPDQSSLAKCGVRGESMMIWAANVRSNSSLSIVIIGTFCKAMHHNLVLWDRMKRERLICRRVVNIHCIESSFWSIKPLSHKTGGRKTTAALLVWSSFNGSSHHHNFACHHLNIFGIQGFITVMMSGMCAPYRKYYFAHKSSHLHTHLQYYLGKWCPCPWPK